MKKIALTAIILLIPNGLLLHPAARRPEKVVQMTVTAYDGCERCCGAWSAGGITSTGKKASICDGVAADPRLLPYGTRLEIPGIGIRVVDDTGGAMRKDGKKGVYHIDVRMKTHQEALNWGRKNLAVRILR